ncbi:unnamed protein product [Mortierella alpina]
MEEGPAQRSVRELWVERKSRLLHHTSDQVNTSLSTRSSSVQLELTCSQMWRLESQVGHARLIHPQQSQGGVRRQNKRGGVVLAGLLITANCDACGKPVRNNLGSYASAHLRSMHLSAATRLKLTPSSSQCSQYASLELLLYPF